MVMSALPTNWNPNHVPTAAELKQILDAIRLAQDPPGCIVRRSATQAINASTFTDLSLDAEVVDPRNMFAPTSTNITLQYDGYYLGQCGLEWASTSRTGTRHQKLTLNNAEIDGAVAESACTATGRIAYNFGNGFVGLAGDIVRVSVWQDSASNPLNILGARLTVVRLFGPGV